MNTQGCRLQLLRRRLFHDLRLADYDLRQRRMVWVLTRDTVSLLGVLQRLLVGCTKVDVTLTNAAPPRLGRGRGFQRVPRLWALRFELNGAIPDCSLGSHLIQYQHSTRLHD